MTVDYLDLMEENVTLPFDSNSDCSDIHYINVSQQCLFATTIADCIEMTEYINYNYYAFCQLGIAYIVPVTIILISWLAFMFVALGITSNYFLCPALFTISSHLGLSQNVAGVTLLAFGNGSPDIFSSVAGFQKASVELAISSLVGAGMFVTCVVAGSVFLTQSFSLMIRPFLRDIAFYIVAISWTFALFFTNKSYLYHGIGFVVLYFVYIIVVLGSRFIYLTLQKQKENLQKRKESLQKQKESEKKENERKEEERKREAEKKKKEISEENPPKKLEIPEITVTPDGVTYDNDPEATSVVLKAFYFGGFEWVDGGRRLSKAHIQLNERRKSLNRNSIVSPDNISIGGSCQSIQNKGVASTEKLTDMPVEDKGELWEFLVKICPVNTKKWSYLQWWKKIIVIIKCPAILVMRITVPVLDASAEDMNWNRLLICTQCVTGPLFISLVTEYAFYMIADVFPLFLLLFCACMAFSITVFCTSERDIPPPYHWLFAYLGFAVAVSWTYCLAKEIVALLQVIGVIFHLSDAILGLTILAWGNSISDFLSNVAVARKNYPRMAISACFGGPLLALLLGLGTACIIEIIRGHVPPKSSLTFSPQFAFLFSAIVIGLLTTALLMTAWKFQTKRLFGVFLISLYITFMILSVLEELKIFDLPI